MFKGVERIYYLLTILSLIFIFLFITQASVFIGKSATYLVFLILITLNVWYGGRKLGYITTIICIIHFLLFFIIPTRLNSLLILTYSIESILFLALSILIISFIEKYKKTDIVRKHVKRENELIIETRMLDRKIKSLQKDVKTRDEFLSIASHELKTPLTSMLLKIQIILHNIRNVSLANFSVSNLMQQLETAEAQTKRLSELINDLLNVSLITTGRMKLTKKEENMTSIVKEVINEFKERINEEGIKLISRLDNGLNASVDRVRIEQVLSNLLSNAIKYGNKKPIDIKLTGDKSKIILSVIDHGIGIPADAKDRIFTLFERGRHDGKIQGLGVGLYIANQIIKAHDGKIKVKSSENHGSEFIVELPVK